MTQSSTKYTLTPTPANLLGLTVISVPIGALAEGISGSIGRFGLSFFNPVMASTVGSFSTFAGFGALAAPLVAIPTFMSNYWFDKSQYFNNHPNLKYFLKSTCDQLLHLAALTATAAILGFPPLGATVMCMMIIPAVTYVLGNLFNVLHACLSSKQDMSIVDTNASAALAPSA